MLEIGGGLGCRIPSWWWSGIWAADRDGDRAALREWARWVDLRPFLVMEMDGGGFCFWGCGCRAEFGARCNSWDWTACFWMDRYRVGSSDDEGKDEISLAYQCYWALGKSICKRRCLSLLLFQGSVIGCAAPVILGWRVFFFLFFFPLLLPGLRLLDTE